MSTELQKLPDAGAIEQVLIAGDLSKLTVPQRTAYYISVCQSVGLNHLTQPFQYLVLNGKLQLYARKDCTDQLRTIHRVAIVKLERENIEGVFVCTAYAVNGDGRQDVSTGAVAIEGLKGEARANAMMKAETKSKRRVTLSICGLGMLDESEVESIPHAQAVPPDAEPPRLNGAATKPTETPAEWSAKLKTRLATKENELATANKCAAGELLGAIEQALADAGLPDEPAKWSNAHQKVALGIATATIKEFEAREPEHGDAFEGEPADAVGV